MPAGRHPHERVGVEAAALGIVGEHAGERDRLLAVDRRGQRGVHESVERALGLRAADQREREHRDRDSRPAHDEPGHAERDRTDEQHPGRRMRSGVLPGKDPGRQSAEREQHAELVHLRPHEVAELREPARRRCRARG